jgi:alpha-mannosidase
VGPGLLANAHLEIRISPLGVLTLVDKHSGETYLGQAELEDEADRGDSYTFSAGPGSRVRGGVPVSSSAIAPGPLVGAVEARWSMKSAGSGSLSARLLVVLHADSPVVRLRFDIDNHAFDHRLRARFPVGAGTAAAAGTALGVERRRAVAPAKEPHAIEQPVRTAPAQRFVAAGQGARGLAVLAPGFFEYEWTRERELLVTLLRSVGELSRGDLPERPGHAAWPMQTPGAQEIGAHAIELALVPMASAAALDPDRLIEWWGDAFLPVQGLFVRDDADA